jgi:GNAT superfamily N-acetyltransferase
VITYTFRTLQAADPVATFDCGEPSLNDYLREQALASQAAGAGVCWVALSEDSIAGYYVLATGTVARAALPNARARRGQPDPVPTLLLGRLAVDLKFQGQKLGRALIKDVITRAAAISSQAGFKMLVVRALTEEAAEFYRRYDFEPLPGHHEDAFMLPMQDIRDLAGLPLL